MLPFHIGKHGISSSFQRTGWSGHSEDRGIEKCTEVAPKGLCLPAEQGRVLHPHLSGVSTQMSVHHVSQDRKPHNHRPLNMVPSRTAPAPPAVGPPRSRTQPKTVL